MRPTDATSYGAALTSIQTIVSPSRLAASRIFGNSSFDEIGGKKVWTDEQHRDASAADRSLYFRAPRVPRAKVAVGPELESPSAESRGQKHLQVLEPVTVFMAVADEDLVPSATSLRNIPDRDGSWVCRRLDDHDGVRVSGIDVLKQW